MAFVSCEWYYEHMLGDSCDNNCDTCFGNKDVRVCVDDFDVPGETLFDRVMISKGSWWFCRFENDDHLLLDNCKGKGLRISKKSYDKHFKDFIIGE
ncbi:MAG: hypothetical protein ACLTF6_01750 [Clostridium sp.]